MSNKELIHFIPRRFAASEIKLLRLDLISHAQSPFEDIGYQWSHAQPEESLSPEHAAKNLNLEIWDTQSTLKKAYKKLQLRYPPEQFQEKHLIWRPSFDLLHSPRQRLNWYWQSGVIPMPCSFRTPNSNLNWDSQSAMPPMNSLIALQRLSQLS